VADAPGWWRRDPVATLQVSLQEKERRMAELEEQLSTQAVRLLLAQTSHQELAAERDQLIGERDHLQQRMLRINRELDESLALIAAQSQLPGDVSAVEV